MLGRCGVGGTRIFFFGDGSVDFEGDIGGVRGRGGGGGELWEEC